MRTLADVLQQLPTTPDAGLTATGVAQSRQRFGANRLTPLPREPLWQKFLEKFDEPIIKILLAAALLSMVVDLFKGSPTVGTVALVTLAVLMLGAYVLRQARWLPTLMFVSAIVLFFVGLAEKHVLVEGL